MARKKKSADWLGDAAVGVETHAAARKSAGDTLICASGISPSGAIHVGNLRELMTTHMVAEELWRRDRKVEHIHSWDDYDRFRKVPADFPDYMSEFYGKPLCDVPDPDDLYDSYATRNIAEFTNAVEQMGVQARWIRQSRMYRRGTYIEGIHTALLNRFAIFDELARYQDEERQTVPRETRRQNYWPYRIYCPDCGTDNTAVQSYDEAARLVTYTCTCSGDDQRTTNLNEECLGKLVWKVDWPMRWAFEKVDFEPGGEDHSSPGGSFTVGQELVKHYDWVAPDYVGYGFIGLSGVAKMSSSSGNAITPAFALKFLEPSLLRWQFLRRPPRTKFDLAFGSDIWRQYDEWDAFRRRAAKTEVPPLHHKVIDHATRTRAGDVAMSAREVGFRVLTASADTTHGDPTQIARIVRDHLDGDAPDDAELLASLEPRLTCARGWVELLMPEEDRLVVREAFAQELWGGLDANQQGSINTLRDEMADNWSMTGISNLIYGVPKRMLGLPLDVKPTPELKAAQRAFFTLIYQLLLGADTGPRLPTLLLSLGEERVRALLSPGA